MNRNESGLVFAGCALLHGKDEHGVLDPVSVGAVKNTEQKRVTCEWKTLDVQGDTTAYTVVHELSKPGAVRCLGAERVSGRVQAMMNADVSKHGAGLFEKAPNSHTLASSASGGVRLSQGTCVCDVQMDLQPGMGAVGTVTPFPY